MIFADSVTFAFASYYGNHMVLQQAPQRAGLWGYASASLQGEVVTVTLQKEDNLDHVSSVKTTVTQGTSLRLFNILNQGSSRGTAVV